MKKYNEYIKIYEDFQEKSMPTLIKKATTIIRKDIKENGNKSFQKNYKIDWLDIDIVVEYTHGQKQPYYSNVNIYSVINEEYPIQIKVIVVDTTIDLNYLMSVISHEIRHIYDVITITEDVDMKDFINSMSVAKFRGSNDFVNLVYLSLEHELIARHNMLYELYRWIDITDKDKLYEIFKESYVYKALVNLGTFDAESFISRNPNLNQFTKDFSESIGDQFDGDIRTYYKKWEKFFNDKCNEYLGHVDGMLDDIINDVKTGKVYERLNGYISYNEDIGGRVSAKLFRNMLKQKNTRKDKIIRG